MASASPDIQRGGGQSHREAVPPNRGSICGSQQERIRSSGADFKRRGAGSYCGTARSTEDYADAVPDCHGAPDALGMIANAPNQGKGDLLPKLTWTVVDLSWQTAVAPLMGDTGAFSQSRRNSTAPCTLSWRCWTGLRRGMVETEQRKQKTPGLIARVDLF
jgi:hypothetical protein